MKIYKNIKANINSKFITINRLFWMYILFFFYLLNFCNYSSAQSKTIDSLKLVINNAKHDTIRMRIIDEIAKSEIDDSLKVNRGKTPSFFFELSVKEYSLYEQQYQKRN